MENPEVEGTGVQEGEGNPEDTQGSENNGQAGDDNGVVTLDVTKQYVSKRRPDVKVSGDQLWSGFQRGQRFDKLQSDHQKLQTEAANKDKEIQSLRAQVQSSTTKEQVAQTLQDLGLLGGQKATAEPDEDPWGDGETPTGTPQITASRIENIIKQTAQNFLQEQIPELKEAAMGIGLQQQKEQELQAQRQQTADQLRSSKIAALRVQFPNASDSDVTDLANRVVEYAGHIYSAVDQYSAQDVQGANDTLFDGEEKLMTLVQKQAELSAAERQIKAQQERDAELEGLNQGSLPGEEPDEVPTTSFRKQDVEKKRESYLEKAKRIMSRQEALKNSGM